jgi:hypothetical protein
VRSCGVIYMLNSVVRKRKEKTRILKEDNVTTVNFVD